MKESEDMRVPLAFLLGKLNFDKDFQDFQAREQDGLTWIIATAASPKTCLIPRWNSPSAPDFQIRRVQVTGYDHSVTEFAFDQEKVNPPDGRQSLSIFSARGRQAGGGYPIAMADCVLKYADARGEIHHQVAQARQRKRTARAVHPAGLPDLLDQAAQAVAALSTASSASAQEAQSREVPDLQPAVRDADPRRPADPEGARPAGRPADRSQTRAVHQGRARRSPQRHAAFRRLPTAGHFPQDLRHLGDGRRESGSLAEVLDRYITYQKLSLAVRKKVMVSLMYPCVLIVLVIVLMVFLVTYVVPSFAHSVHQHAGASCRP